MVMIPCPVLVAPASAITASFVTTRRAGAQDAGQNLALVVGSPAHAETGSLEAHRRRVDAGLGTSAAK